MNQKNSLLESPTGTGKTISLLASAISFMYQQRLKGNKLRLVYASRTHSQLDQVMHEFRKLPFNLKIATLASKVHLCLHSSNEQNNSYSSCNTKSGIIFI